MKTVLKKFLSVLLIQLLMAVSALPGFAADPEPSFRVFDTTAGSPAMILLEGDPTTTVGLSITNPFGSTVHQKVRIGEKGTTQYWYPTTTLVGEYFIEYAGQKGSFRVTAGEPNTVKSSFVIDYTSFVDESAQGLLTLRDSYGNAVPGYQLNVSTKKGSSVVCNHNCISNASGQLTFSVKATKTGLETLRVMNQRGSLLVEEQIGFIPRVSSQPLSSPQGPYFPSSDFIPVADPTRATFNSQGNDDRWYSATLFDSSRLVAQIESDLQSVPVSVPNALVQANQMAGFDISVGSNLEQQQVLPISSINDSAEPKQVTIASNSAQDILVRAVDSSQTLFANYTGTVRFELTPAGPLLPPDFQFNAADQGTNLFELALILPSGQYTLTVTDTANPLLKGEILITSQLSGAQTQINNTNIVLTLDSPVADGVYSAGFPVQGTTSTDNTQIIVKEGVLELAKSNVDASRSFNFPLDIADGVHDLQIIATYLVDGSQASSTVRVEVDQTPPVITQVESNIPPVKEGENFTMNVIAEANATLDAFIDNRSYTFTPSALDPTKYSLIAAAPALAGEYPITLRISDRVGNTDEMQNAAVLEVLPSLKNIKNLFGIPGAGTMTLSWDPVEGAVSYEVTYLAALGTPSAVLTSSESNLIVENLLAGVSYTFTVTAKDSTGADASLPTDTRALQVLAAPTAEGGDDTPLRPAADEAPRKHTQSGPEVYLFVLLSIAILHGYAQVRKALAK